ncbi:accessory factor UbiK family protein [Granulibacter bethesdensis]|nr:accessory factor UbiK family protein [Granulibacter bethesdensis]
MTSRPRFLDDLAGLAGGALSAVSGLREEVEALVRARVEETLRRLDVARREDLDVALELAATARDAQEALQARVDALEQRVAALEANSVSVAQQDKPSGA